MKNEPKLMFFWKAEATLANRTTQDLSLTEFLKQSISAEIVDSTERSPALDKDITSKALLIGEEKMFRAAFDNGLMLEFSGTKCVWSQQPNFLVHFEPEWIKKIDEKLNK